MFVGAFTAFGEEKSAETIATQKEELRGIQSEINALNKEQRKLKQDVEDAKWMRDSQTRRLQEPTYEVVNDIDGMTNAEIANILTTHPEARLYSGRYDCVYISYVSDTPNTTFIDSINRLIQNCEAKIEKAERRHEENRKCLARLHAEHSKAREVLGEMQRCFNVLFRVPK